MVGTIRKLLEMIRFSHTLFALPFALSSAALAWKTKDRFSWLELTGILLCMAFARSAAMAFNRLMDRDVDALNPRTAGRHLPTGQLSIPAVWNFFAISSLAFIGSTLLFLLAEPSNPWPLYLSVPVLVFICLYSLTKRFTALSHFWLGASLLLAPVAAWIAILGLDINTLATPILLGLAVLFWVAGFDILYACQDAEFDRKAKLHSVPTAIGIPNALRVAMACHAVMVCLLLVLLFVEPLLGWTFAVGVSAVAALLAYEHSIVRADDLGRVNQAFFQVNAVISIGLFVVVLLQIALLA